MLTGFSEYVLGNTMCMLGRYVGMWERKREVEGKREVRIEGEGREE